MKQEQTRFKHTDCYPDTSESAHRILPVLLHVAGTFRSAIDVGGGVGAWARALKEAGVASVVCIDSPLVDPVQLLVEPEEFQPCDLVVSMPETVRVDLAVCIEVAEHLPAARAEDLVRFLVKAADVVLFSAAIPGQPSGFHVNEQPAEYWRALFAGAGLKRYDCIRPLIIEDREIPYWYRQNMYLFASDEVAMDRGLTNMPFKSVPTDFELVHSGILERYRSPRMQTIRDIPRIVLRSLRINWDRATMRSRHLR